MKADFSLASSSTSFETAKGTVRRALHICFLSTTAVLLAQSVAGFTSVQQSTFHKKTQPHFPVCSSLTSNRKGSSTELQVKWFGGGWQDSDNSDELLGVKIERTSPNSRRIAGEIIISKSMDDVWAILTDYDNLAIHVPNLVESRRVGPNVSPNNNQGDGSYKCRLFQKGAQKIIGFEFGASVTMDMTENIRMSNVVTPRVLKLGKEKKVQAGEQRRINFKCVESQFFSEFDGEWKCSWIDDPNDAFELATKVEYVVDVRPRGPVPVQALEWRIREDVPTNLRAVKAASMNVGAAGVQKMREEAGQKTNIVDKNSLDSTKIETSTTNVSKRQGNRLATAATKTRRNVGSLVNKAASASQNAVAVATAKKSNLKLAPVRVQWYDDETMATYLDDRS